MMESNRTYPNRIHQNKGANSLLKKLPLQLHHNNLSKTTMRDVVEQFNIKINLESIHYTGKDYGCDWTFVISTLNHHWISSQIKLQRGEKSLVDKNIYNSTTLTSFDKLKHLSINICAQHKSGFSIDTTLYLQPSSFKQKVTPKNIYTNVENMNEKYQFHEIKKTIKDDIQLMFVFNFEVSPNLSH